MRPFSKPELSTLFKGEFVGLGVGEFVGKCYVWT